ncbi:MAG: nuclear transport factor 2 family protein [Vicinamibacterales bacterium]
MNDTDREVRRVIGSYEAAVRAKDVEALMRLYHPAVRVFDTWGVWLHEGAPAWRIAVEGWFASLGSETVKVSFSEVHTTADASLAVVSAIVTYAAQSAQGEALRSLQNRITWVLRESGHVFRIAHEHTSAPIGFEDFKAILTRG